MLRVRSDVYYYMQFYCLYAYDASSTETISDLYKFLHVVAYNMYNTIYVYLLLFVVAYLHTRNVYLV